jgi:hypothetical protein
LHCAATSSNLTLEAVRLSLAADEFRPVAFVEGIKRLTFDRVRFPTIAGPEPACSQQSH